jgi:hypothetical protein
MGMIIRHKKNRATILNEDMIPNSFNNSIGNDKSSKTSGGG